MSDRVISPVPELHPVEKIQKNKRDKKSGDDKEVRQQPGQEHQDRSSYRDKGGETPSQQEEFRQDGGEDQASPPEEKGQVLDIEV